MTLCASPMGWWCALQIVCLAVYIPSSKTTSAPSLFENIKWNDIYIYLYDSINFIYSFLSIFSCSLYLVLLLAHTHTILLLSDFTIWLYLQVLVESYLLLLLGWACVSVCMSFYLQTMLACLILRVCLQSYQSYLDYVLHIGALAGHTNCEARGPDPRHPQV